MSRKSMNHSDSVSSTDSSDDLELVAQLTRTFLSDSEFTDEIVQELSQLNKENVIRLLSNLLESSKAKKTDASEELNTSKDFEINNQKTSLSLTDALRVSQDDTGSVMGSLDSSAFDGLPTNLIITSVAEEVFSSNEARAEFEQLFLEIDSDCKFCHLRIFNRCTIQFSNPIAAILARVQFNEQMFLGESLKMFLSNPIKIKNSRQFLEAPKNEKTFLISPPSSPPVGWEQVLEDPPVVNLELLAALSTKLNPFEPCEIVKSNENMPGIIIHPCTDSNEFFDNNNNATRKFMPTRRPANDIN